jgi:phosphoserine phosphatase
MTRLYLTRHGQTEWNLEGRLQGSMDSSLTQKGIEQALQLGKWLKGTNIDVVYSSSSQRALHTAKLITEGRNINISETDELKEMNLGYWEGLMFDEIHENYGRDFNCFWNSPHTFKNFPGETYEEFKTRVIGVVEEIIAENKGKDVLIVTHAIVLKFILSHFDNRAMDNLIDGTLIHPTSLSVVEVDEDKHKIVKFANTEHYNVRLG